MSDQMTGSLCGYSRWVASLLMYGSGVLLREALVLSHDRPPMHDSVTEAQVLLPLLSSVTAAAPSLDPSLQKTDVVLL